jgi:hypothetical protein
MGVVRGEDEPRVNHASQRLLSPLWALTQDSCPRMPNGMSKSDIPLAFPPPEKVILELHPPLDHLSGKAEPRTLKTKKT